MEALGAADMSDVFVIIAATVLVTWVMTPPLMMAWRERSMSSHAVEIPAAARPRGDDALYQQRFDQLAALGFQPVGIAHEVGWFVAPSGWRKRIEQRWMALPDGQTFARLNKLFPGDRWRFGMATLLSDGCLVRTSCPADDALDDWASGYRSKGMSGVDPAELLERHREHVDDVCRERVATIATTTFPRVATRETALNQAALSWPHVYTGTYILKRFLASAVPVLIFRVYMHEDLCMLDLAYAGGIASIMVWLFIDFVLIPKHRAAVAASHSPSAPVKQNR